LSDRFDRLLADAILGIDTLWGGDVTTPTGAARVVADTWFSDEPLPPAFTVPAAARLRATGGVAASVPDRPAIAAYLDAVDVKGAIAGLRDASGAQPGPRRDYGLGLAECLDAAWDLAMEVLGEGPPVPYERFVRAACGCDPAPSNPARTRQLLAELLARAGHNSGGAGQLQGAVDEWRRQLVVPARSLRLLSRAFVARFDHLAEENLVPYLPQFLATVPRCNITFQPVDGLPYTSSCNYVGRARKADGSPEYEATYELGSNLAISVPEFAQLVCHAVVPGHVTRLAYLQGLYVRGGLGFEATVTAMCTRGTTLAEGIAVNSLLIAHGVTEVEDLPEEDLQIAMLLAMLVQEGKSRASYLTWKEGAPQREVAAVVRNEYLMSEERADLLSRIWVRHPLVGRMYVPCFRAGMEVVADLRRRFPPEKVLPVLYGCSGLMDITTVGAALR